jgi:hypothetical protein
MMNRRDFVGSVSGGAARPLVPSHPALARQEPVAEPSPRRPPQGRRRQRRLRPQGHSAWRSDWRQDALHADQPAARTGVRDALAYARPPAGQRSGKRGRKRTGPERRLPGHQRLTRGLNDWRQEAGHGLAPRRRVPAAARARSHGDARNLCTRGDVVVSSR